MNRDDRHCDPEEMSLAALGESTDLDTRHLAACETCQAELASLRRVVRTARSADDAMVSTPSSGVWAGVRAAMGDEEPAGHQPQEESGQKESGQEESGVVIPIRQRRAPWIALAAAVGVVLGGVAGAAIVQRTVPEPVVLAQATLAPLPGYNASGDARVQSSESGDIVSIDLAGLPATEGYYEVWLLTEDSSAMVSLGAVGPGERSTLPLPPGIALDRFTVVDVSAEEFDGDPTHSAISVARGTLNA